MTLSISTFWALAVLMIAIACVFVLVPFFKFSKANTYKGLKSNWYRTRLQELDAELEKGQFSQQQYNDALKELKLTATDELREEQNDNNESSPLTKESVESVNIQRFTSVALVLLVLTTFTGYWFYGQQQKLVQWEEALERFPELSNKVLENRNALPSSEELRDFSLGLRTKLQEDPKAIGWMLLGRNLQLLGDLRGAIDAFEKSYNLDPKSIGNMTSYAAALQQNGQPGDYSRSIRILKNALTLQPQNLTALILTAEGYLLDEQFEQAYTGFNLVSRVINPQDPRAEPVKSRLTFLSQQLGNVNTISKDSDSAGNDAAASELEIVLNVKISANIDLNEFKTLFLFAKKPGMAMPLAVKKLDVKMLRFNDTELSEGETTVPQLRAFEVSLTDKNVMVPGMSLLGEPQVDIFARLSVDTEAPKELGDLEASVTNLMLPATKPVELLIKK